MIYSCAMLIRTLINQEEEGKTLTCIQARLRSNQNCFHQPPFFLVILFLLIIALFLDISPLVSAVAYKMVVDC